MICQDNNELIYNKAMDVNKSNNKSVLAVDIQCLNAPTYPILHQNARFWYVFEGKGKFKIQGDTILVEPGTLIGVLPWQCTEVVEVTEPIKYYVIVYEYDLVNNTLKNSLNVLKESYDLFGNIYSNTYVQCDEIAQKSVERICNNIVHELGLESTEPNHSNVQPLENILLFTLLVDLCIIFYRVSKNKPKIDRNGPNGKRIPKQIEIFHYMYYRLNDKISLQDLSDRYYMSKSAISKYIYDTIGISFNELVSIMRMGRLLNFIHFSDMTLKELSVVLGYADASHVSKFFHSKFNMNINDFKSAITYSESSLRIKEYEKCKDVIIYILENYSIDITIDDVANKFNISHDEVNSILEYYMEKTFNHFLNYVRIINASEILLTTNKSVYDIAFEVGYNTSRTFNRNFIKVYNISPTEFRKKTKCQSDLL